MENVSRIRIADRANHLAPGLRAVQATIRRHAIPELSERHDYQIGSKVRNVSILYRVRVAGSANLSKAYSTSCRVRGLDRSLNGCFLAISCPFASARTIAIVSHALRSLRTSADHYFAA